MNWERSEHYDRFLGCRFCVHYRRARCVAYPGRIPLSILSGDVDHMVKRPGQIGEAVFEPIDVERWWQTGQRVPLASPVAVEAKPD